MNEAERYKPCLDATTEQVVVYRATCPLHGSVGPYRENPMHADEDAARHIDYFHTVIRFPLPSR